MSEPGVLSEKAGKKLLARRGRDSESHIHLQQVLMVFGGTPTAKSLATGLPQQGGAHLLCAAQNPGMSLVYVLREECIFLCGRPVLL